MIVPVHDTTIGPAWPVEPTLAEARLAEAIQARSARVVVIGLGFIGALVAEASLRAGFQVTGLDRAPGALASARARLGLPEVDPAAALDEADVVLLAVRALVQPDGSLDLEPFDSACRALAEAAPRPRLVLVESTLPPGGTRALAARLGPGFFVAHSPERLSVGHGVADFRRIPHLVGGIDPASGRLGVALLSALVDQVVPVAAPEVSELSKLLENGFMSVAITLVEEVARLARAHGVSGTEVSRAAASKPFGYLPFHPGPGIGGHCLPNDLAILRAAMAAEGGSTLLDGAAAVVAALPERAVGRLASLLEGRERGLQGARVLLVGVGFKVGSADTTETPARAIARALARRGARASFLDTRVPHLDVDGEPLPRVGEEDVAGGFDAILVLAGDDGVQAASLVAPVVLDTGGGRALIGALSAAERL